MDKNFNTKSNKLSNIDISTIRDSNTNTFEREESYSETTEATIEHHDDLKEDKNSVTIGRCLSFSKKDVFYRKAKEEGFRARSVYKLQEINDNFNILENADNILDLCVKLLNIYK